MIVDYSLIDTVWCHWFTEYYRRLNLLKNVYSDFIIWKSDGSLHLIIAADFAGKDELARRSGRKTTPQ